MQSNERARTLVQVPVLRIIAVSAVSILLSACVGPTTRIPDPACDHCYRTESGIPYKTWEAYDP